MKHAFAVLPVLLAAAGLALADAKLETFTRTTMPGGIGTMEANNKTEYQADREYTITNFRMTGLVGAGGKYQNSVLITRLDKGVVWELHHGNKTYAERPLTVPAESADVESGRSGAAPDRRYKVVKADIAVSHPGNKKEVNGFACTDHVVTFTIVLQDTATKEEITEVMTTTLWLTPFTDVLRKTQAEQKKYYQAYAAKVNSKLSADEASQLGLSFMTSMLGLPPEEGQKQLSKVSAEMAKLDGYAVITDVNWQVRGDSATQKAPAAPEPEPAPSPLSLSRGGLRNYIGNQIARKAIGDQQPQPADALFASYVEVKSVSIDPVPAADFEIPEGYKKVAK